MENNLNTSEQRLRDTLGLNIPLTEDEIQTLNLLKEEETQNDQ